MNLRVVVTPMLLCAASVATGAAPARAGVPSNVGFLALTIPAHDLARSVARVQSTTSGAVSRRTDLRFEARDGKLLVTASDGQVAVSVEERCVVSREGVAVVRAKTLFHAFGNPPGKTASLSGTRDGGLELRAGALVVRLPSGSPDRFAHLLDAAGLRVVPLRAKALRDMLDQTAFASSKDPERYNLSGVFFESAPGKLRLVATDGRRLSIAVQPIGGDFGLEKGVILSSDGVSEFRALAQEAIDLEGPNALIEVGLSSSMALARRRAVTVSTRPINGFFPDYASAIPQPVSPAKVDRTRLLRALKRVAAVAGDGSRAARLDLGAGTLRISSAPAETASVEETLDASYAGAGLSIVVNPQYIMDVLQVLSSGFVEIRISGALAPITIGAVDEPGFTAVIMPIRM